MNLARELLISIVDELRADPTLANQLRELLAPAATTRVVATNPEPVYATVPAFCTRMGWSRSHVESLIKSGLPVVGCGRARRIPIQQAEAWLSQGAGDGAAARCANASRARAAWMAMRENK